MSEPTENCIMDFPTAWEFVRATKADDHHEKCSWRVTNGALLCDCRVLWDEYERRKLSLHACSGKQLAGINYKPGESDHSLRGF